jgi:hypothetical protein
MYAARPAKFLYLSLQCAVIVVRPAITIQTCVRASTFLQRPPNHDC